MAGMGGAPQLLVGTGKDEVHLLIVATSDRGLAGGFNASIVREARRRIRELDTAGKRVKILTIGSKGRDSLRRDHGGLIHDSLIGVGLQRLRFEEAQDIATRVLGLYETGEFDVSTIIFNRFRNVLTQIVTAQQLIPLSTPADGAEGAALGGACTNSSPRKRRSSPSCCRTTLRCRFIQRCWKTRLASKAPE
jgi:F-type H+-transporting ATPase subunit gamma